MLFFKSRTGARDFARRVNAKVRDFGDRGQGKGRWGVPAFV